MKAFARQLMQAWLSQIVTHLDAVAVVPCVICQFEAYGRHRNYHLAPLPHQCQTAGRVAAGRTARRTALAAKRVTRDPAQGGLE